MKTRFLVSASRHWTLQTAGARAQLHARGPAEDLLEVRLAHGHRLDDRACRDQRCTDLAHGRGTATVLDHEGVAVGEHLDARPELCLEADGSPLEGDFD